MSSVSSAVRRRASGGRCSSVRMLCSRSASLISSTRTSSAMASSSLRRFSACLASLRDQFEPLQLGQALDQHADVVAEHPVDLGAGGVGILDGVVQQRRGDGGVVELEVGEDRGDFQRVREIRIAGGALLLAMRLHGVDIGAVEQVLVGLGLYCLTRSTSSYCRIIRGLRGLRRRRVGLLRHELRAARRRNPRAGAGSASAANRSASAPWKTLRLRWRKPAKAGSQDIMAQAERHKTHAAFPAAATVKVLLVTNKR